MNPPICWREENRRFGQPKIETNSIYTRNPSKKTGFQTKQPTYPFLPRKAEIDQKKGRIGQDFNNETC
jgi:hypothetical protein